MVLLALAERIVEGHAFRKHIDKLRARAESAQSEDEAGKYRREGFQDEAVFPVLPDKQSAKDYVYDLMAGSLPGTKCFQMTNSPPLGQRTVEGTLSQQGLMVFCDSAADVVLLIPADGKSEPTFYRTWDVDGAERVYERKMETAEKEQAGGRPKESQSIYEMDSCRSHTAAGVVQAADVRRQE
jgi:hypothetical protein